MQQALARQAGFIRLEKHKIFITYLDYCHGRQNKRLLVIHENVGRSEIAVHVMWLSQIADKVLLFSKIMINLIFFNELKDMEIPQQNDLSEPRIVLS